MYEAELGYARTVLISITWSELVVAVVTSLVGCIAVGLAAMVECTLPTALIWRGTDVIPAFDKFTSVLTLG